MMITGEDENTVNQLKKYIDNQAMIGDGGVDWEKVMWIETLDRMVNCLKIAPLSYRYCTKEEIEERFYTAECSVCGWWGSSKLLDGGGAIADTGDHFDCVCPVCSSPEIDDKGDEPIQRKLTTMVDSFGTPIYEGDTVEYYHWCYANEGIYQEGEYNDIVGDLPDGFIERAIENGFTAKHTFNNIHSGECVQMFKPCVGVVKWNERFATYEPVIFSEYDYDNNCFYYVINESKGDGNGSYCKVISSNEKS